MKKVYPVLALVVAAWLFSSCQSGTDFIEPTPINSPSKPSIASTPNSNPVPDVSVAPELETSTRALEVAQSLTVRGRSAATSYNRDAFGSAWKDVDRNGCDTRNDILKRDFMTTIIKANTGDCKVIGGTWVDPYSNESYTFYEAPSGAQIDHVVSLKNAWQMGADQWDDQKRVEFANDPLNLRVTIASLNQQKSDSNAASWLPPYKPGRCQFVATQVAVKAKWNLFVTESEKEVFISILSKPECSETQLPK